MPRNYWMVVATLENFEISKGLGFTLHGVGSRYRRRAQRMQPDDRVLYYVETIRKWAATATIRSKSFEDRTPIWKSPGRRQDHFGYRVKLAPDVVLAEEDYIDAMILAPSLEYLKKWTPEIWPLAFHDRLHLLPQKDFRLIESEMNRNVSKRGGARWTSASDRRELGLGPRPFPVPEARIIEGVAPEAARYEQAEQGSPAAASDDQQRIDSSPGETDPPLIERDENEPGPRPDPMPEPRIVGVTPEAARYEEAGQGSPAAASDDRPRIDHSPGETDPPLVEREENEPSPRIEGGTPEPSLTTSHQTEDSPGASEASPPSDGESEEEPRSSEAYPATDGSSAGST